jgi:hypothetical protein
MLAAVTAIASLLTFALRRQVRRAHRPELVLEPAAA